MRIGDRALRILGHMIWEGGWECIYLCPVGDLTLPYPALPYPTLPYPTLSLFLIDNTPLPTLLKRGRTVGRAPVLGRQA